LIFVFHVYVYVFAPSRSRLAIVDESNVLMVYDMISKQLLYQEPNATSVCWNQTCEVRGHYSNLARAEQVSGEWEARV